jgi:uncharacterized protein YaaR (DUF327 family)
MDNAWIEIALRQIVELLQDIKGLLEKEGDDEVLEELKKINEKLEDITEAMATLIQLLERSNEITEEIRDLCEKGKKS